jgi:hypothetical protein
VCHLAVRCLTRDAGGHGYMATAERIVERLGQYLSTNVFCWRSSARIPTPVPVISMHLGRVKSSRLAARNLLFGPAEAAGGGISGYRVEARTRSFGPNARCVITEWPCASHLFGRPRENLALRFAINSSSSSDPWTDPVCLGGTGSSACGYHACGRVGGPVSSSSSPPRSSPGIAKGSNSTGG